MRRFALLCLLAAGFAAAGCAHDSAGHAAHDPHASHADHAAPAAHDPHAAHETDGDANIGLNDGRKWETDAPLREGMTAIKGQVLEAVRAVDAGTMSPDGYVKTGAAVAAENRRLIAECKLSPEADRVLHDAVLIRLIGGAAQLQSDDEEERRGGLMQLAEALERYGELFDHPGWTFGLE